MSRRSQYTDSDRARVHLALQVNDGNMKRTSRDTGIPVATVRDWKRKWESEGVPDEVANAQIDVVDDFVTDASRIRDKALNRLEQVIDDEKNVKNLATVIGILDDKITRARGLPTSRQETLSIGISGTPQEVQALFTNWAQKTVSASSTRDAEIIESEAVEVEQPTGDSTTDLILRSDD